MEKEYPQLMRQYKKLERDYRALSIMHEQTERLRNSNEAAKELSNFYNQLLLKNTPGITFMLDLDMNFVLGSEKTVSLLGYGEMREMVGFPFPELFANAFPDGWIADTNARCLAVTRNGRPLSYEEKVTLKDGAGIIFQVTVTPAEEKGGICRGVVVVMNDVSELARAKEDAERASISKGAFLANMSHEMRTPLNAVIGMTAIGKASPDAEKKNYCLNKIDDASTHLLSVINDVLDMSKIEANKLELSPAAYHFEKMLQKVVSVNNFRVEEKQQEFSLHVDKDIPRILIGDDARLAQVITNLLSNAVKFTPLHGHISLKALLLQEKDGLCSIQIEVSDTGIGISEEQQSRLFSSFEQADSSTSRKFGGTGLGLAISKRIVEMMGGKIWINSEISKGSTFAFTIQTERAQEETADEAPGPDSAPADCFAGRRVILAEDVELNREVVLALLEPTELAIDCAENGLEAVRLFSGAPDRYDMIFMDVQMPDMDGYSATRHIRALDIPKAKQIPIIAMTANVFPEDIEMCLASGMDGHVGKPLDLEAVLGKLREHLPKNEN
ncbi:MAG: response regulator [Clostridiales Family XIII bacterium]|jgi:PAS domain S-box-containing protein|nr:response regulator [Clostridiales Family XIII bacterium]